MVASPPGGSTKAPDLCFKAASLGHGLCLKGQDNTSTVRTIKLWYVYLISKLKCKFFKKI